MAGTVKRGTLVQGSNLLLGPHAGDASFKLTGIKSIAYKRLPVAKVRALAMQPCFGGLVQPSPQEVADGFSLQVVAGQTAALALKKVKRSSLRKVDCCICCKNICHVFLTSPHVHKPRALADMSSIWVCRAWCLWTAPCTPRRHGSLMQT